MSHVCRVCGRRVSDLFVHMWDYCPECKSTPFPIEEQPEGVSTMNRD